MNNVDTPIISMAEASASQPEKSSNHGVGLNCLLMEYYNALTHVCTVGGKLAGRLDDALAICDPTRCTVSNLNPITHLYKDILVSMGPLREATIYECPEEDEGEQYCKKVEMCSAQLYELHQQIIQRGSQLLESEPTSKLKPALARKHSPCIIVTDTDQHETSASTGVYRTPSNTTNGQEKVLCSVENDTTNTTTKNQVPTDDDMTNIINFLSSTHIPRKTPLTYQRSSPLPQLSSTQECKSSHAALGRSHSDWQAYAVQHNSQQGTTLTRSGRSTPQGLHNGYIAQQTTSGYRNPNETVAPIAPLNLQLPFTSGSKGWLQKDSIWSNNDSSSDESLSTTEQLFKSHSLDLSGIVSQTRRSSHDSNASGQNVEAVAAALALSQAKPTMRKDDGWGNAGQSTWTSTGPTDDRLPFSSFNDNVWKPLGGNRDSSGFNASVGAIGSGPSTSSY